jgi:threonine dehydratase
MIAEQVERAHARIAPHVVRTPLTKFGDAWLKCENLQHTGSFKFRGAINMVLGLDAADLERGVVAASTGNHGRGVAHALQIAGARGVIYLPTTTPPNKVEALRAYPNVTLEFHGDDGADTEVEARAAADRTGRTFISPYNDAQVIAGQGTIGMELLAQLPALDSVYVSVGGAGLISGIASYLKARNPKTRVVGCWAENAPALYASLEAGRLMAPGEYPERPTLSDGTAGGVEPGTITFELARALIDDCVLVSEAEIADAMRSVHAETGMVLEGAAGVAIAGHRKARRAGETAAIILCGGNIAPEKFESALMAEPA